MFKKIKAIHLLKSTIFDFVRFLLLYILIFTVITSVQGQQKEVVAKRINSDVIIDGKLDESFWEDIAPAENFQMIEPINGKMERLNQKTKVKFAYDDFSIYIGAILHDKNAGYDDPNMTGIMKELGARDEQNKSTDLFGLFINPFNDGINEFSFLVTAAGVQIDKRIILTSNGYIEDLNWDAVWESAVKINKHNWIVEMRIPYSAIRFPNKEIQEWGLNIYRQVRRYREDYSWSFIDVQKKHIGAQSGLLKGIKNITPPIRLSLTPYISSMVIKSPSNMIEYDYSGGIDLKYGFNLPIGKENINFTLDMILLPEFQQVEFDPLILNTSPFEVKYDEKRSFFTEGIDLFQKGNLFYSRRIGNTPQKEAELNENEILISTPVNTRLFNATKISGRTKDGWGFGVFNAITKNAYAEINDTITQQDRKELLEPITNYNMLVVDKSFNQNSFITLINTNVTRAKDFKDAHVLGLIGSVTNKKKTHTYDSSIKSSFIKEDSDSQLGFSTYLNVQKISGNLKYSILNYIESDQYDINDMGFLSQNNEINTELSAYYEIFSEDEVLAKKLNIKKGDYSIGIENQMLYKPLNYNKLILKTGFKAVSINHLFMDFKIRYFFEENDYFEPRIANQVFNRPPATKISFYSSSNYNKPISLNIGGSLKYRFTSGYDIWENYNNIDLYGRINPRIRINNHLFLEYILAIETEYNQIGWIAYNEILGPIFSRRQQNTFTNKFIINYTLNPKAYIKIIARHYWSTINNKSFYELSQKGDIQYSDYDNNENISFNTWNIDTNFSWEYQPGSIIAFVWQNQLTSQEEEIEKVFFNNLNNFFANSTTNIFSIKFTYYLDYATKFSKK